MKNLSSRSQNEIIHGKKLSERDPESTWGWGTSAGILRARRRASLISSFACISSKSKVLEIGCGSGFFTKMFAQSGANITAIDISHDLLKLLVYKFF